MPPSITRRVCELCRAAAFVVWAAPVAAQRADVRSLEATVRAITTEYNGETGVAVEHIESGRAFAINGHKRFPLASVSKLGIMLEAFAQVEEGKFTLADRVEVTAEQYHPWGGIMSSFDIGLQPTVRDVIFWMIVQTDNLATDIMFEKVGGAANIRARLRGLGLDEFSVDRSSRDLLLQYYGFPELIPKKLTREEYRTVSAAFSKIAQERLAIARVHGPIPEAVQVYLRDPRDTGSPLHLNLFLVKMFRGELVSPAASRQMLDIMLQTRTGRAGWVAGAKLVGLLPAGTAVAHKTGDWPTANNDVGIIYLPDDRGHVAISLLTTNMNEDSAVSAHMIARIARAVYDFFVASP